MQNSDRLRTERPADRTLATPFECESTSFVRQSPQTKRGQECKPTDIRSIALLPSHGRKNSPICQSVQSCSIQEFAFLGEMPKLEKPVVPDCRSEAWHTILENKNVQILRLHTLMVKKGYLEDADFISKFPNVEYLYMNNFNIMNFPDVSYLPLLHTVMCSGRKLIDYLALEHAMSLKTFIGWCATDNHRTPAESFIPILKNPSLREFQYTQMFNVENKKLDEYVQTMRPDITYPIDERANGIANTSKTRDIAKLFF